MAEGGTSLSHEIPVVNSSPVSELREMTNLLTRLLDNGEPYDREENRVFIFVEENESGAPVVFVLSLSRPSQDYTNSELAEIGRLISQLENRKFTRLRPQIPQEHRLVFLVAHVFRDMNFDDFFQRISREFLNGFTVVPLCERMLGDDDVLEVCVICLEEEKIGQRVKDLPCSHVFHSKCIDTWLVKNYSCPLCRKDLQTNTGDHLLKIKKTLFRQQHRLDVGQHTALRDGYAGKQLVQLLVVADSQL
uniref:RING-type domain-containing protein n=1 Tax=Strigamia maritima TaxID=126957 RepID=T1JPH6_STRMM